MIDSLKKPEEFRTVFQNGSMRFGRYVAVHLLWNESEKIRIGVSASKKVGKAVVRNRVKRRIKEALRDVSSSILPGVSIVVGCKAKSSHASYWELREDLSRTLKGLGALR